MKQLLKLAEVRPLRLFLEGPPGAGKTFFARELASKCGAELFKFNFDDSTTPEDLIFRYYIDGTEVIPVESTIVAALRESQKSKVVLLLDEIDKARPRVEGLLLPLLEEWQLQVGKEVIQGNPSNIHLVATSNGARELWPATLRRFLHRLKVDFPPKSEQVNILVGLGVPENAASVLVNLATELRQIDANMAPSYPELAEAYHMTALGLDKSLVEGTLWRGEEFPYIQWNWFKALKKRVQ